MKIAVMGAGGADTLHADMKASLLHDLENAERLEAPVNRTVYGALAPYVHGK